MEGLEDPERRYQNSVENSIDAIVSVDERGVITVWNRAAEEMFGYSKGEIFGKEVVTIISEEYREQHKEGFTRFLRTGRGKIIGKIYEGEGLRKDGSRFPLELSLSAQREGSGYFFTSIIRDVTKRKSMEEKLKHSNKLRDLFVDIMHHDLMNPISIIKTYAEVMMDEERDKTKRQELQSILNITARMQELIENATKYAKLGSQKELEFEREDLDAIIKDVLEEYDSLLQEKRMEVVYTSGEYLAEVSSFFRDVISNLLSNAIKYSPKEKKVVIEVQDEGRDWEIRVKDNGQGIADDDKATLFDRFKRIEKGGVKGTGLGLAIVKRIVRLHHGEVWIEDNLEGGSIFCVRISKRRE
ncbi:MAG: PAS domain-containing sensor histidine kinase [Candidatus Hydrothermarchaeales archaeon]